VQDIMQRLGLPAESDAIADPHQAAIALAMAMNQARLDMADRAGLKAEAQTYGIAKLDALRRKLMPLYAAIPHDVELFDLGLVTPEKPRLFVDILSFIEMNRDQTAFRFLQETRAGRITLAESADETTIINAVTQYVARRLVERELALGATSPVVPRTTDVTDPPDPAAASVVPDAPLRPEMPKAMQSVPMTAEEAFRRWTRVPLDAQPNLPQASPTKPAASAAVLASAVALKEAATAVLTDNATRDIRNSDMVETAAQAVTSANAPEAAVAAAPVAKAALAAVATAAAVASGTAAMRPATSLNAAKVITAPIPTSRSSGSWWLWSFLALLIGIGLGALALYLYAANLAR
jgi:hypothetical protein